MDESRVSVLTPRAVDYRKNHEMKKLYELLEGSRGDPFLPEENAIKGVQNIYQMCGLVLENRDGTASLFLHTVSEKGQDAGGFGKTALSLRFLGVELPYGRIPSPKADLSDVHEKVREIENSPRVYLKSNPTHRLVCSDMPYMGLKEGRIVMIPPKGQLSEFQWDLARHLFRMMRGEHYKQGDRHKARELLFPLATKYVVDKQAFSTKEARPLKNVFYLTRSDTKRTSIERINEPGFLRKLLEINPDYNTATFWEIDRKEKAERLKRTLASLTEFPRIYIIKLPKEKKYVSKDIYDAVIPFMG